MHGLAKHRGVVLSIPIPRSDDVDDVVGRQGPGTGDGCLAGLHWTKLRDPSIRFFLDRIPTRPDDGAGHPTTMFEVLVGGIDDGIDTLLGEVALDNLDHP